MSAELRDEIAQVLNRYSRENRSDTPDHLLAEFVLDSLDAFDRVVRMREGWYGRVLRYGTDVPAPLPAPEEALLHGAPSRDDELAEKRDRLQEREEPGEYVALDPPIPVDQLKWIAEVRGEEGPEEDRTPERHFDWDENTPLGTALGEAIGLASMCWTETPGGIFESERAGDIVNELLWFLTKRDEDAPSTVEIGGQTMTEAQYDAARYPLRPASLGIVEDRTPEQLAADGDSYQPAGDPDANRG